MPAATSPKPKSPKPVAANKPTVKAAATAPRAAPKSSSAAPLPTLTLSSKNYSSWSLRGWLIVRLSGLKFTEVMISPDDVDARRELLLLAPSTLVPCLTHEGAKVWNTVAIAHYLDDILPDAALMPTERIARAHCRSVSGEMNAGFTNLRASMPMNLKAKFPGYKIWAGAQPDIDRIVDIWTECLATYAGPFLFGRQPGLADAMFAPVVTRFLTYDVPLPAACIRYCQTVMALPEMQEWVAAAMLEPEEIEELDMEF